MCCTPELQRFVSYIPVTVHKNQSFIRRLRFALAGLAAAWRSEPNFRLQLGAFLGVVVALGVLRVEPVWWAIVLLNSALVMTAELLNTALECLADHLHPQSHPRIRGAKDCAAAAVLIAAAAAVAVGLALIVHLVHR